MFFEDEKDSINNGADIHISDDGVVSWDDVLQESQDNLVDIKSDQDIMSTSDEIQDINSINLGDDLEVIQDDDDDVSDDELARILNEDNEISQLPKQKAFDAFGQGGDESEVTDINQQLQDAGFVSDDIVDNSLDNNQDVDLSDESEVNIPRKEQIKKSTNSTGLLLALLFAILVAGGVYYAISFTKSQNLAQDELLVPNKQEEMNNLTQEDIANRQQENIPVVNEEEVGEIKPDVQEKKEVINIVQTGRSNPFMPIQKYIEVEVPQKVIQYDKAGIPAPPSEYGIQDEDASQLMNISVSGIMYDDKKPSAIITYDGNDYFVQEGDMLDKYRVADIQRSTVAIALGKNIYTATIGEEFKIGDGFYGSATYTSSGHRQYQMVDPNYVSESEVDVSTRSSSSTRRVN